MNGYSRFLLIRRGMGFGISPGVGMLRTIGATGMRFRFYTMLMINTMTVVVFTCMIRLLMFVCVNSLMIMTRTIRSAGVRLLLYMVGRSLIIFMIMNMTMNVVVVMIAMAMFETVGSTCVLLRFQADSMIIRFILMPVVVYIMIGVMGVIQRVILIIMVVLVVTMSMLRAIRTAGVSLFKLDRMFMPMISFWKVTGVIIHSMVVDARTGFRIKPARFM